MVAWEGMIGFLCLKIGAHIDEEFMQIDVDDINVKLRTRGCSAVR